MVALFLIWAHDQSESYVVNSTDPFNKQAILNKNLIFTVITPCPFDRAKTLSFSPY